ncbi:MAG: hypothetical protein ACR2RV_06560 [Verrucomicrobiales bacterium]
MRAQYHLRPSAEGLLAWDVRKLVALVEGLPVEVVPLSEIRELDQRYWFGPEGSEPTCRAIADHARLIGEADLSYPIILDPDGRVMDGMHRVCRALAEGAERISAYRLIELPEPDSVGVPAGDLPYD